MKTKIEQRRQKEERIKEEEGGKNYCGKKQEKGTMKKE